MELKVEDYIIFFMVGSQLAACEPNPNCGLTLLEIANQDVPKGQKFKLINRKDIPSDLEFRDAWELDFTEFDGVSTGVFVNAKDENDQAVFAHEKEKAYQAALKAQGL